VKISCPTCSAKYSIADEKVQNRLAKIRCRKCGTAIVIDGNVSPAHVYAAEGGSSAADELTGSSAAAAPAAVSVGYAPAASAPAAGGPTYTVDLGENDQRQMTVPQLVDAYNTGAVTADTYVWTDGFADWTPLGQVDSIVAALHAAAAGPAGPVVDEASATAASTHVDEKPWNSGPFRGAAAAPSAGGADLFGSVSDAGNESEGLSVGTAANPFSGATTGARNESSVLFSLSALTSGTGSSRSSAPPPSAANTSSDDSGLIDLKALTAMAQAAPAIPMAPAPIAAVSPFGAAPLGGLPSHAAPAYGGAKGSIPAPKRNNTGLIIGVSIIIAAVAVAAIVTFGGSEEQPVAPPAPAVTSAPIAAPAPAPEPTPAATAAESDAKPPATGSEQTDTAPNTKKKVTTSRPKTSSSPSPAAAASPSPAPAPKPKSSGGGKCGCRSDDLMCLMNCAK